MCGRSAWSPRPSGTCLRRTPRSLMPAVRGRRCPSLIKLKNATTTLQSFTYTDSPAGTILNEADTPTSSQSPAVYTYDAKGRVTSMTPGTGSTLSYGFDASSNLTTLPIAGSGSYDKAGELTSSTLSGATTTYAHNAGGPRAAATPGGSTLGPGTWGAGGER